MIGLVSITINTDKNLKYIEKKLGSLKSKASNVLVKAINQTAKDARKELAMKASEEYTIKNGGFNKGMKIENATKSKPKAIITATGKPLALSGFKTQFSKGEAAKAKVLKKNRGLKALTLRGGEKSGKDLKAFIVKFSSKHTAVVQRVPGKKMKDKNKEALKEFYSVSIPRMIGNEKRVYKLVKPNIKKNLKKNIDIQIEKLIAKSGGGQG